VDPGGCRAPLAAATPPPLDLVPYPSSVVWLGGNFDSGRGLRVVLSQPANPELHRLGELAADILRETPACGQRWSAGRRRRPELGLAARRSPRGRATPVPSRTA
jgi:hypothetical protein